LKPDADVIVVGAGPAGCTLAYLLAARGRDVLVLDKEAGPIFKIGESLLPAGVHLCHEMGLKEALEQGGFMPKWAARFVLSDTGDEERFPFSDALRVKAGARAYQVKRRDFDDLLHRHARSAGARYHWGARVAGVDLATAEGPIVRLTDGETLSARFVVDATGQGHFLARELGLRRPIPGLAKTALFAHFERVRRHAGIEEGDITVLWNSEYWTWIIPFTDGTTSVGVVGNPDRIRAAGANDDERFAALCSATEHHRRFLAERVQLFELQRRADFSYQCTQLAGPRFVLIGDAASFIDPLFSTGVFLAQQGAFLAERMLSAALEESRALSEAEQQDYTTTMQTAIRRFLALVQGSYDHGFIETAVRGRRRPGMRRAFISLLAGDVLDEENPLIGMGFLAKERMI